MAQWTSCLKHEFMYFRVDLCAPTQPDLLDYPNSIESTMYLGCCAGKWCYARMVAPNRVHSHQFLHNPGKSVHGDGF